MVLRGEMPLFQRRDGSGGTMAAWQRKEMLVALLHPGCERCAMMRAELEDLSSAVSGEELEVVLVTIGDPLEDPEGSVSSQLSNAACSLPQEARLILADRFARLYASVEVHGPRLAQALAEALGWIQFIQSQCEECGAPLDWA